MNDPTARFPSTRLWILLLFWAWAIAFVGGYVGFWLTSPTDFGFVRGLNRIAPWAWGHAAALGLAAAAWVLVRRRRASLAWGIAFLGRVPVLVMGIEVLTYALVLFYVLVISTGT